MAERMGEREEECERVKGDAREKGKERRVALGKYVCERKGEDTRVETDDSKKKNSIVQFA